MAGAGGFIPGGVFAAIWRAEQFGLGCFVPAAVVVLPGLRRSVAGRFAGPGARVVLRLFARFGGGPLLAVKSVGLGLNLFFVRPLYQGLV